MPGGAPASGAGGLGPDLAAAAALLEARGLELPGGPACARPARWGGLVLGGSQPLIAATTTGAEAEGCARQARAAAQAGAHLVELRADLLQAPASGGRAQHMVEVARCVGEAGGLPVLLTVRTTTEGGRAALSSSAYTDLLKEVIETLAAVPNEVVALDIEHSCGHLPELVALAGASGLATIGSSHAFQGAPGGSVLLERLRQVQEAGASVAKVAVMPRSRDQAQAVLALCAQARAALEVPVVVIAMGQLGAASRLEGWRAGSALSFATTSASPGAPGQLTVEAVRAALPPRA